MEDVEYESDKGLIRQMDDIAEQIGRLRRELSTYSPNTRSPRAREIGDRLATLHTAQNALSRI
ncbi:MAG: hypothetical protein WBA42_21365 [Mesorhizobium sp.]